MTAKRRAATCEACGGGIMREGFNREGQPTWDCQNCSNVEPRRTAKRLDNRGRAFAAYKRLAAEWKPVDEAIEANGGRGYLVHHSLMNTFMNKLLTADKPTNQDLHVWKKLATEALESARAFTKKEFNA